MAYTYYERVASRAMLNASFAPEGGVARCTYLVANSGAAMWAGTGQMTIIEDILGTSRVNGAGGLSRTLPKAHPVFPYLYASRITSVQGIGKASTTQSGGNELESELITDVTAAYPYFEIQVEFTPRMYSVVPDHLVLTETETWYDEDGLADSRECDYEHARYTDFEVNPNPEVITGQQGQSFFVTDTDDIVPTPDEADYPHGLTYQGFPRITVPRAQIVFRWYQVPYSYVSSPGSYLSRYIGYINQQDFLQWPAGSLLYEGPRVRRYTPPAPDSLVMEDSVELSAAKLCDIELMFSYVRREQTAVPNFAAYNGNWVTSGHNLMPWFGDRKFYHAVYPKQSDQNTPNYWVPTYLSIPFILLFQNPDAEA